MASRLLLLLLLAACSRTTLQGSVADKHGSTHPTEEMDFWDEIAKQPAVTNRDAMHALLLSFGGAGGDWTKELKAGKDRAWVASDRELKAHETAAAGWIARAVCIEAGIKGGLTMRVLGPSERYATKELNYMGWLRDMSPSRTISGAQLIAVLSKAEDRIRGSEKTGPKEDL
jgi:hypothetical protein